jgi:hypothetical protein
MNRQYRNFLALRLCGNCIECILCTESSCSVPKLVFSINGPPISALPPSFLLAIMNPSKSPELQGRSESTSFGRVRQSPCSRIVLVTPGVV